MLRDSARYQLRGSLHRSEVHRDGRDALETVEARGVSCPRHDVGALFRERLDDGKANTLARGGDDGNFPRKLEIHSDFSIRVRKVLGNTQATPRVGACRLRWQHYEP